MAVRALDGNGSGSTAEIAEGVRYAAQEGAGVINLSLGGWVGAGDAVFLQAVQAAGAADAVVVVAAGNALEQRHDPHGSRARSRRRT